MKLTIKTQNRDVKTIEEIPCGHLFKSVEHVGIGIKGPYGSAVWVRNSAGRVAA